MGGQGGGDEGVGRAQVAGRVEGLLDRGGDPRLGQLVDLGGGEQHVAERHARRGRAAAATATRSCAWGAPSEPRSSAVTRSASGRPPASARLAAIRAVSTFRFAEQVARPGGGGDGELEQVAVRLPLGVPGAGRALVLLLGAGDQGGEQAGGLPGAAEDGDGGDRVALVRHRGRAAAAGRSRRAAARRDGPASVAASARRPRRPRPPRSARAASRRGRSWTAPRTRAIATATSMIRSRSVCQGSGGSARPSSSASSAFTRAPSAPSDARVPAAPPNCTASRVSRTNASHSTALSSPASQPAATTPKVTGTACCSSVRPIISVPRCASASRAAAAAAAVRCRPRRRARRGRAASPRCP